MRKRLILGGMIAVMMLAGCSSTTNPPPKSDTNHLYRKEIDAQVTKIDKRTWYASTHHYVIQIEVKSDEYGLTHSENIVGSGAMGRPPQWEYEVGDTVKATMLTWKNNETGGINKRIISNVK